MASRRGFDRKPRVPSEWTVKALCSAFHFRYRCHFPYRYVSRLCVDREDVRFQTMFVLRSARPSEDVNGGQSTNRTRPDVGLVAKASGSRRTRSLGPIPPPSASAVKSNKSKQAVRSLCESNDGDDTGPQHCCEFARNRRQEGRKPQEKSQRTLLRHRREK
jgi:hypothetical protein